jgi:hypothetical protein
VFACVVLDIFLNEIKIEVKIINKLCHPSIVWV